MAEDLSARGAPGRRPLLGRPVSETPGHRPRASFFRRRRFLFAALVVVAAIGGLIYMGLRGSSMYYMTVAEIKAQSDTIYGNKVRLGATVANGSIQSGADGVTHFVVTDGTNTLPVSYQGSLPDSFKDGADVVLQGSMASPGTFEASSLLAKCPSKYETSDGGSTQSDGSTSGGSQGD